MLAVARRKKLQRRILAWLVGLLGPVLIRLLAATLRIRTIGDENHAAGREGGQNVIYCPWHQAQLLFVYTHRGLGIHALISQHADGDLMARTMEGLGFGSIRGSTTRGGSAALRRMVRIGREGHDLAITPDGPRGPLHKVQPGVITLARLTGFPILHGAWSGSRMWELGSWDRFRIPKPFSRVVIVKGGPFRVPREITPEQEEEYRVKLEKALMEDLEKAEALVN